MFIISALQKVFGFGDAPAEFELLETESGMPYESRPAKAEKEETSEDAALNACLQSNIDTLKTVFRAGLNKDIVLREFMVPGNIKALLVYINGMSDAKLISEFLLKPIMRLQSAGQQNILDYLQRSVVPIGEAAFASKLSEVTAGVLDGQCALLIDGEARALILESRGYEKRSVENTQTERVIRGPQEGFNESLRTNITLIRRIVRTSDLVSEIQRDGGENGLQVAILYREGVANPALIDEVKRRLGKVKTRFLLGDGMMQQFLEKHSLAPFDQTMNTERPDRAAAFLMQGHVVMIFDGSPNVLIAPTTFFALINSPEDIYMRRPAATMVRVFRYTALLGSLLLPGMYIAMLSFHQGLVSAQLMGAILASRSMVSLPILWEIVLLLVMFQLVREASIRAPAGLGQAMGVIGGLILGQAAVAANIVSAVSLIVVAFTGLGTFALPGYSTQFSLNVAQFILLLAGAAMGLVGMAVAILILTGYLVSTKSFGVPFFAPFAPKAFSSRPAVLRGNLQMRKEAEDIANTTEGTGNR